MQEARYQIAQMFIAQEKWQEGINALNEWFATAVNPNSTAYYLLAVAYYQLKKPDQALAPRRRRSTCRKPRAKAGCSCCWHCASRKSSTRKRFRC